MKKLTAICIMVFVLSIGILAKAEVYIDDLSFTKNAGNIDISGNVIGALNPNVYAALYLNESLTELKKSEGESVNISFPNNNANYKIKLFVWDLFSRPLSGIYETNSDELKIYNTIDDRKALTINNFYASPFPNPTTGGDAQNTGKIAYALLSLYKNTNIALANSYIIDACTDENKFSESKGIYFQIPIVARIYIKYENLLTEDAKAAVKSFFWEFNNLYSNYSQAQDSFAHLDDKYFMHASGNHHVIKATAYLLGNQILKNDANYKNLLYPDGYSVNDHYNAWEHYWQGEFELRGSKTGEIEYFSNGYDKYTMDSMLSIFDCSEDAKIKKLAKAYLDLYTADMLVQSNNGLFGGARGRSVRINDTDRSIDSYFEAIFFNNQSQWRIKNVIDPLTGSAVLESRWTNSGISYHPNQMSVAVSDYKPPYILQDLAKSDKGSYEYSSNIIGRGYRIIPTSTAQFYMEFPSYYKRFSYVTPDYIVGGMTYDRNYDYTDIQQQNRYVGIHFNTGRQDPVQSRVFVHSQSTSSRGFNDINTAVNKSTMIVQSLPEAKYTNETLKDVMLGFSKNLYLNTSFDESGWLFAYDPYGDGYLAIRPSKGTFDGFSNIINPLANEDGTYTNTTNANYWYLLFSDRNIPIVMQAGSKKEFASYEAFKNAVKSSIFRWNNNEFEYSFLGNSTKAYLDKTLPKINNQTVNLTSDYLFNSPYLVSEFASGKVTVKNTKGERIILNFK